MISNFSLVVLYFVSQNLCFAFQGSIQVSCYFVQSFCLTQSKMFKTVFQKLSRNNFGRTLREYSTSMNISPGKSSSKAIFGTFLAASFCGGAVGYYYNQYQNDSIELKSTTKLKDVTPFKYAIGNDLKKGFQEIEKIMGIGNFTRSPLELDYHSDSYFNVHKPLEGDRPKLIVYPTSTEQVSQIMKVCYKYRIPIVPYSGGTSLEGQYISSRSGIVLDFSRMNKVLAFHKDDLDIVVQPGVGWQDLDEYLKPNHLLFGPDPGPGAKIGGMVSTSCSGTQAFRYGTMKENVLNLTVVLADGTILKTKQRSKKSAAGYNLTGLFIGAEGTLGVITEATLKLAPRPVLETVIVANFNSIKEATLTVEQLLQNGGGSALNAIELLDNNTMACINEQGATTKKWMEKPTLLFKIGGSTQKILNENINIVKEVSKKNNNLSFQFAKTEEDKAELWQARKMGLFSTIDSGRKRLGNDAKVWITDVAVPISKLLEIIAETKNDLDAETNGVYFTCMGHVGDGNFHTAILYKPEFKPVIKKLTDKMIYKAIDFEGTCTGEHGIGMGKRQFLIKEVGQNSIDLMRHLKLSLDPYGILNGDKIFKLDSSDHRD